MLYYTDSELSLYHAYALIAKSVNKSESKIQVSRNEAYGSVELHKPEEVQIYKELEIATENQGAVITTRNEAYASWTMQHNN
jgi:hypothetical protein